MNGDVDLWNTRVLAELAMSAADRVREYADTLLDEHCVGAAMLIVELRPLDGDGAPAAELGESRMVTLTAHGAPSLGDRSEDDVARVSQAMLAMSMKRIALNGLQGDLRLIDAGGTPWL